MTRALLVAVCATLILAPGARAQDAPPTDLDALRAQAREPASPTTWPITLVHLAEALLDELARDAADTAALVGIPTPEQHARVLELGAEASFAIGRFDLVVRDALAIIESDPEFAASRELQDLRSALAVEYAEFRAQMVIARSGILLASVYEERAGDPARVARNAVDAVSHLDLRQPRLEARRDIVYGVASLLGADAPAGGADAEPARVHFQRALDRDDDLAFLDPRAFVEASLGLARAHAQDGRRSRALDLIDQLAAAPPFLRDENQPEPAYFLILEDARFLADRVQREGETPAMALARAENTLLQRILTVNAGVDLAARRALALEKLATLKTPRLESGEALTPLIAAARARAMTGEAARDEAIDLLQASLDTWIGAELLTPAGAEAAWRLASLLLDRIRAANSAADAARALDLLLAIAIEQPDFPDAPEAMHAAGRLARSLLDAPGAPSRDEARAALRAGLEHYPEHPSADRWRLTLAEREGDRAARIALLEAVNPDSLEGAYAGARLVDIAHEDLTRAADADARTAAASRLLERFDMARAAVAAADLPPEEARDLRARVGARAIDALLVLERESAALSLARSIADAPGAAIWTGALTAHLRRQLELAQQRDDQDAIARLAPLLEDAARLRLEVGLDEDGAARARTIYARALLAQNKCAKARNILDDLIEQLGRREDLLLDLADALRCLRDDESAFPLYREVVQPLETRGAHTRAYWRAWAGMLEILARQNTDGARTDTIRREIARLRALDESLGGPATKRRIEAIAR